VTFAARARWLLLDPAGRRILAYVYLAVGAVTVAVYWVRYSPVYALVQAAIIGFGLWCVRWCIRR
jgi:hypothetical protein